jgi:ATP-dependent RNA helicase SUPV3L1/SUV3
MHGEIIVLDEVHWAADKERGWAWTRLLLGAQYRHIHLAGAPDALPLVRSAFPDVSVVYHERLCPLSVAKQSIPLSDVPERAVVVAFSRKAVHYIARLLKQHGRNPAVLYGAMPPGARRAEISRFVNGDADVVVATDVIGHGINLPVAAVLFAETSKYDGNKRRDLQLWEVAQIAGRAGRYGFETHGTVGSLKGIPGMAAPIKLLAKSERPKVDVGDGLYGYRKVTHGRIAPHLSDLAVTAANELPFHLEAWSDAAVSLAKSVGWVTVASVADIRERLRIIDRSIGLDALDVETAWRLARGPLDPTDDRDVQLFTNFSYAIVGRMDFAALIQRPLEGSLETLESLARQAAGLRWFTLTFPGVGGITHSDVISYEDAVTKAILSALNNTAMTPSVARCPNCGAQRAPWTRLCDTCYQARNDYYYEY